LVSTGQDKKKRFFLPDAQIKNNGWIMAVLTNR